jgi:hypothetical protein
MLAQAQQEVMQVTGQLVALKAEQADSAATATVLDGTSAPCAHAGTIAGAAAGASSPDAQLLSLLAERDAQLATMEAELAVARAALAGDAGMLLKAAAPAVPLKLWYLML